MEPSNDKGKGKDKGKDKGKGKHKGKPGMWRGRAELIRGKGPGEEGEEGEAEGGEEGEESLSASLSQIREWLDAEQPWLDAIAEWLAHQEQ